MLPERMVEKTAREVLERQMRRDADRAWQARYKETVKAQAPYLFVPKQPDIEREDLDRS